MDSLTFTINLKDLDACKDDFDHVVSVVQAFITILHRANPDYTIAGNILQMQLDEQVKKHKEETDPVAQLQRDLDIVCPVSVDGEIASAGFWQCYDDLRKSIGKHVSIVFNAAYKLAKYIENQNLPAYKKEHDVGTKWLWDFVHHYTEFFESHDKEVD